MQVLMANGSIAVFLYNYKPPYTCLKIVPLTDIPITTHSGTDSLGFHFFIDL